MITSVLLFFSCKQNPHQDQKAIEEAIDSLVLLTHENLRKIEIDSAEVHIDEALKLCEEVDYSLGCTEAYIFKGQILYYKNSFQESLKYLLMAEKEPFAKKDPGSLYEIHRIKGQIYLKLNLLDQTIKEFKKALANIPKTASVNYRANASCMIYENLTTAYNLMGDSIKELETLREYHRIVDETDEAAIIFLYKINAYNKVADYYMEENKTDSAKYYLHKAIELASRNNYTYFSNSYISLGDIALGNQELDSAINYYGKAMAEIENRSLKNDYALIYDKMARAYEVAQMDDSAKIYQEKHNHYKSLFTQGQVDVIQTTVEALAKEQKESFRYKLMLYLIIGASLLLLAYLIMLLNYYVFNKKINRKEKDVINLTKKVNLAFDEVMQLAKDNDSSFLTRFSEVYVGFIDALNQKHPNLTKSDLSFCAMNYLGFDTKEIAAIMFVEVRTVQTRRSRLRKKMDLDSDTDIYQYLHSLESPNR